MGLTRIRADQVANLGYTTVRVIALTNVVLNGGAPLTVDGVALATNSRVLVAGQDTAAQNGIYRVGTAGTGANGVWTRAADFDQTGEIEAGLTVMVTEGTEFKDTLFKLVTNNPIVIGETALAFAQNSAFDFGNIVANGTAIIASSESDTVTFTAGDNVLLTANAESKTINFDILTSDTVATAGNTGDIQFNNAGALGASSDLTFIGSELTVTGTVVVTGNVSTGNVLGTTGAFTTVTGNGSALTSLNATNINTGTLLVARGGTGVTTSTGTGAVVLGTSPVFTTQVTVPAIVKNGTTGVGNIGQTDNAFNTVFAKATSAQYADVAEMYAADADYSPGTVLIFGGGHEVTASDNSHSTAIAGVVSTDPAYLMNSNLTSDYVATVALLGRVPCRVVGTIRKGQCVVASDYPGVATAIDLVKYIPGCVIGKALEDFDSDQPGTIEVVVGRA